MSENFITGDPGGIAMHRENVRMREIKGVRIIAVSGDFTVHTTPKLQKLCDSMAKHKGTRAVLIDLKDVKNVDSAPFACMINFIRRHMHEDIAIGIVNMKRKGLDLMEILKVDRAIRVFDDMDEAVSGLNGGA
jgi:anti-anti-sigma factor